MHVLLVTREFPPSVVGGVAYHSYNLARALRDLGHDVSVLTAEADRTTDDGTAFDLDGIDVVRLTIHERGSPRLWFDREVRRFLDEDRQFDDIDLVHSHEYLDFRRLDMAAPAILKVHFNLSSKPRFREFDHLNRPLRIGARLGYRAVVNPLEQRLARRAVDSADGQLFVSELVRNRCRRDHGSSAIGEHAVVYNGVDADRFTTGDDPSRDYFLFVGGTQRRKGYDVLTTAARDGRLERPLRVVGADRPTDASLPNGVVYEGHVDHERLPHLYRDALAVVHPALYEPFGNVVLESLACGTPVVVSGPSHCGAAELLDGTVATLVDPLSPTELRCALTTVPAELVPSSDCRSIAKRYTWTRVAERTVEFGASLRS